MAAKTDLDFVRIDKAEFAKCRSESIDYAVMERTKDALVLPLDVDAPSDRPAGIAVD